MRKSAWPSGFYFDDGRGKFYARFVGADGRRVKRWLSRDEQHSLRWYRKILLDRDDEAAGLGDAVRQRRPLAEIVTAYCADVGGRTSPAHARNVKDAVELVVHLVGVATVRDLSLDRAYAVQRALRRGDGGKPPADGQSPRQRAPRTVNKILGHFVSCLSWAEGRGMIARNPLAALIGLPERQKARVRHRLTVDEARRLVAAVEAQDAERKDWRWVPQTALVLIQLETGLRFGEAAGLEWRDLTTRTTDSGSRERFLIVRPEVAKTDKPRALPVRAGLDSVLRELRSAQGKILGHLPGERNRILLTPRGGVPWSRKSNTTGALRWFNAMLKAAEIEKTQPDGSTVDWHSLRHTFCQRLRDAGVPLSDAADLMGHKDERLTRAIYSDTPEKADRRVRAVGLLPELREANDDRDDTRSREA